MLPNTPTELIRRLPSISGFQRTKQQRHKPLLDRFDSPRWVGRWVRRILGILRQMSSVALLLAQNRITTPIFTSKVIAPVIGTVIAREQIGAITWRVGGSRPMPVAMARRRNFWSEAR